MKNTRKHDLEQMEAAGVDSRRIDQVYRQSKNSELEAARKQLIEAHKRRDLNQVAKIEQRMNKTFNKGR